VRFTILPVMDTCVATFSWLQIAGTATVTEKFLEAVLPAASVAVVVTGVVPMRKRLPEAGLLIVRADPSAMSVAEVTKLTLAPVAEVA